MFFHAVIIIAKVSFICVHYTYVSYTNMTTGQKKLFCCSFPHLKVTFSLGAEVLPLDGSEKRGGSFFAYQTFRLMCKAEKVLYTHF